MGREPANILVTRASEHHRKAWELVPSPGHLQLGFDPDHKGCKTPASQHWTERNSGFHRIAKRISEQSSKTSWMDGRNGKTVGDWGYCNIGNKSQKNILRSLLAASPG